MEARQWLWALLQHRSTMVPLTVRAPCLYWVLLPASWHTQHVHTKWERSVQVMNSVASGKDQVNHFSCVRTLWGLQSYWLVILVLGLT